MTISCEEALKILHEDFADSDAVGVRRAVAFLRGEDETDDALQAEVMGFIRTFIDQVWEEDR